MTSGEALQAVTRRLHAAGIDDAGVEAELLLRHALSASRTQIHTESGRVLTWPETRHLKRLLRRRLDREPSAYILGHCGFYGIDLYINRHTLIPRPETELLVEATLELARQLHPPARQLAIADIGTGCGAIAIALALALPQARVYATDISAAALHVAEINCRQHGVNGRVELLCGNLLEPLARSVDMIVANLPYIKDRELDNLDPEISRYEPRIALAGGEDGLAMIQAMLEQVSEKLRYEACFLLEIGHGQADAVSSLVNRIFPQATVHLLHDPGGIARVVKAVL